MRERGQRGVRTHRTNGLLAHLGHVADDQPQVFFAEPEVLLVAQDRRVTRDEHRTRLEFVEGHLLLLEPLAVGGLRGERTLHFLVVDDAPLFDVDQEHSTGLEATLLFDVGGLDRQHADLASEDHALVFGDPIARGTKAVAVQNRAHHLTVTKRHRRRAVPRFHECGVVAVEVTTLGAHRGRTLPGLGDHHQHGVRQRSPRLHQELDHLVEARRVAHVLGDNRGQLPHRQGQ